MVTELGMNMKSSMKAITTQSFKVSLRRTHIENLPYTLNYSNIRFKTVFINHKRSELD